MTYTDKFKNRLYPSRHSECFANKYSYYIVDDKWILVICVIAKPERKANAQWLGDVGIEGREEASRVGLTLGKKFICASFLYL